MLGQFPGKRHWKEDYLLNSNWNDQEQPPDIAKIIEIILHLLHQLQHRPRSALSYKDFTFILQLEFWFIPWLFHAWTTATTFVPSYFIFIRTLQGYSELPCMLCFSLQYPCCSHTVFPIVILLYAFSYIRNQDWKFNISLQSFKNLKRNSRLQPSVHSPVHLLSLYHSCYANTPSFFCMFRI